MSAAGTAEGCKTPNGADGSLPVNTLLVVGRFGTKRVGGSDIPADPVCLNGTRRRLPAFNSADALRKRTQGAQSVLGLPVRGSLAQLILVPPETPVQF